MFDFVAAIAARPSDAGLPAQLGVFRYTESSSQHGAVVPDPAWAGPNLVKVDLTQFPHFPRSPGGVLSDHLWMHKAVAPVFVATMQEAERRGVLARLRTYDGCYVARHMGWTPGRPLSVHSWAAALDFDARWNGYGIDPACMQIDRDFVQVMEECGWTWGGRWTGSYCDGMHFQWTDPLPGTRVAAHQDAMARLAGATLKPIPAAVRRTVRYDGKPAPLRFVAQGTLIAVQTDGSVWMRAATPAELAGNLGQPATVTGISQRVTLQQQDGAWVPFTGGSTVYHGLHLALNAASGDLSITTS